VKKSLIFALAASLRELPSVELQGWRCSSKAAWGHVPQCLDFALKFLPWALPNLKFRGEGRSQRWTYSYWQEFSK